MAASALGAGLTEAHRTAQTGISTQAVARIATVFPLLDPTALDSSFPGYADAATAVLADQRAQSARLAAAYVSAFRDAEGVGALDVAALGELAREQAMISLLVTGPVALKTSIRTGATLQRAIEVARSQTLGAVVRLVQQGSRDTIRHAILADDQALGYARVTDGKPCYFCAMLASRGAVYRSEATASFEAHGHCGCQPEPLYHESAPTRSRQAEEWDALYRESTAGKSGADARAAFRAAYEGRP